MKMLFGSLSVAALVLGSSCGGSSTTSPKGPVPSAAVATEVASSSTVTAPLPPITAPSPTVAASPTSVAFAGYGTLDAEWSTRHKADASKNAGTAYDRQASGTDRFALVQHSSSGRIIGFTMQYDDGGIAIGTAQEVAREQLPSDATVLLDRVAAGALADPQCQMLEYQSASLAAFFADPKIGDPQGYVDVIFSTSNRPSGDATYDPNHVDTISIGLGGGADQLASC